MKEKPGMRDGSVWLTAIPLSVAPGMPGPNPLASTAKQVVFLQDLSLLDDDARLRRQLARFPAGVGPANHQSGNTTGMP